MLIHERKLWLKQNPTPWNEAQERAYFDKFAVTIERWLDNGAGSCALRSPDAAKLVGEALNFFDGERYWQHSWVIMPNHVHTLFSLAADVAIESVLQSWKSFTSHQLKARCNTWPGWQRDYFDRIIRDEQHFFRTARYVRNNPPKAGLATGGYTLWESEAVRAMLLSE